MISRVAPVLSVAVLGLSAAPTAAQGPVTSKTSIDQVIDQLATTRRFGEVQIAPDGKRVAYTSNTGQGNIWMLEDF